MSDVAGEVLGIIHALQPSACPVTVSIDYAGNKCVIVTRELLEKALLPVMAMVCAYPTEFVVSP